MSTIEQPQSKEKVNGESAELRALRAKVDAFYKKQDEDQAYLVPNMLSHKPVIAKKEVARREAERKAQAEADRLEEKRAKAAAARDKEVPCRFWQVEGYCKFEERCRYAHAYDGDRDY
jgi:hypothetical protein